MERNDDRRSDGDGDGERDTEAADADVVDEGETTLDDVDADVDLAVVVDDCVLAFAVVMVPTSLMTARRAVVTSLTVNHTQFGRKQRVTEKVEK